jgi:hypothetical protein
MGEWLKNNGTGRAPPADPEGRSPSEVAVAAQRAGRARKRAEAASAEDRVPTFEDFEREADRGEE